MNLYQIDYVLALAKHLNFTAAAKSLYITQPALSKQIVLLEEMLGLKLFYRDKRSVRLTAAGELFVQEFKDINAAIENSIEKIKHHVEDARETLRIGYPLGIEYDSFLPTIVNELNNKNILLDLKLSRHTMKSLKSKLLQDELDVIFSFSFDITDLQDVVTIPIEKRRPYLIMSPLNPLSKKKQIKPADLNSQTFLRLDPQLSKGLSIVENKTFKSVGLQPSQFLNANNSDTLASMCEMNIGVTVMDRSICNKRKLVYFDLFQPKFNFDVVCLWKKDKAGPLINLLRESINIATAASPAADSIIPD